MGTPDRIVTLQQPGPPPGGAGMDRKIERKTWPPRRIALFAGGGLILLAIAYVALNVEGGRVYSVGADRVTISTVTQGTFDDFIPVRGQVAPLNTVYIESIEGGRVEKKLVEDGAMVKAGQPLIELSNATLQLDVISREAQIAEQVNNLQTTDLLYEQTHLQYERDLKESDYNVLRLKRDLDRKSALLKRGTIPRETFDLVKDEYDYQVGRRDVLAEAMDKEQEMRSAQSKQLQETVDHLNANLDIARRNLDGLTIKAPIDGQLTALDAEVGQSKERGARLGQIDSVDAYKITAAVDEFYVSRINVGQPAGFMIGTEKIDAEIAKVYPQIRDGRFQVDLKITGKMPAGLRRGQTVDLRLELGGAAPALLIGNGPFYQDTGGNWIFVLSEDGKSAVRRDIRLGRRNPQFIEVLSGLEPGEKVVTSSYESFLQMDRVEFDGSQGS